MNKGLEYIRDISCLISENYSDKEPLTEEQKLSKNCFLDYCKYIEKELQRLEKIDNAKTGEALKGLKHIKKYYVPEPCTATTYNYLEIIEQSLIKAQENEKVLEVIKEKGVDVGYLKTCKTLEEYNSNCWNDEEDFNKKLTEEEFDLLKRYFENENNK